MSETLYTFNVQCTFNVQYTFNESSVEPDPEGRDGDVQPTEAALQILEAELLAVLHNNYAVDEVQAFADSDQLLGKLPDGDVSACRG
jgi:hypothetical protein